MYIRNYIQFLNFNKKFKHIKYQYLAYFYIWVFYILYTENLNLFNFELRNIFLIILIKANYLIKMLKNIILIGINLTLKL